MLRVKTDQGDIEVRFDHKWLTSIEIENMTGEDNKYVKDRRCSLVLIRWDGKDFAEGLAICHSHDNFCKATGRKLALEDALLTMCSPKIRTAIWEEYKARCKF